MDPAGPVSGLPSPPRPRDLPDLPGRQRELLALIGSRPRPAVRPVRRGHGAPRWAVPLAAATAVAVIAVTAAVVPLLGHRAAPRTTGPGAPASTGPAGVPPSPCAAPDGARCDWTGRYSVAAPLTALVISDATGSVTVTGGTGAAVTVTEHLDYRGLPPRTRHTVSGGELTLGYQCRSADCGVSYDVQVPRTMAVQVSTGTGDVVLRSLAGPVTARAGTGDIRAQALAAPAADLRAGTGSVTAVFVVAPARLTARVQTGPVTIVVPGGTSYAVTASSGVGPVSLRLPRAADAGHVIQASTGIGPVTITAR